MDDPVTDRPDDLRARIERERESLTRVVTPHTWSHLKDYHAAVDALADALGAAQKERDGLARTLRLSDEDHDGIVDHLEARVRQLEEALRYIAGYDVAGYEAHRRSDEVAREVLAAKENTTP